MKIVRALKFVVLPPKRIDEREEELIEIAKEWIELGFDGVVFNRCSCGKSPCDESKAYYLKCGHSIVEGHFFKIYNDYCPRCISRIPLYLG
ncbi:MAG: hypothetical protein QW253_00215 [Metallosphaera sp.]